MRLIGRNHDALRFNVVQKLCILLRDRCPRMELAVIVAQNTELPVMTLDILISFHQQAHIYSRSPLTKIAATIQH